MAGMSDVESPQSKDQARKKGSSPGDPEAASQPCCSQAGQQQVEQDAHRDHNIRSQECVKEQVDGV